MTSGLQRCMYSSSMSDGSRSRHTEVTEQTGHTSKTNEGMFHNSCMYMCNEVRVPQVLAFPRVSARFGPVRSQIVEAYLD